MVWLAMIASALAGLCGTALMILINKAIADPAQRETYMWLYLGVCLFLPIAGVTARLLLVNLSQKAIYDLRLHLCRSILRAPLRNLEEIGANKLFG